MTKKPRDGAARPHLVHTSTLGSIPGWDLDENAPADKRDPARPGESYVEQLRAELAKIHEENDTLSFRCHGATVTITGLSEIAKSLGLTLAFAAAGAYAPREGADGFGLNPIIRTNQLVRSGTLTEYLEQPLLRKIRVAINEAIYDAARTLSGGNGINLPADAAGKATRRALRDAGGVLQSAASLKDRQGAPRGKRALTTKTGIVLRPEDVEAEYEQRSQRRRTELLRHGASVRRVRIEVRRELADEYGWTEPKLRKVLEDAKRMRR